MSLIFRDLFQKLIKQAVLNAWSASRAITTLKLEQAIPDQSQNNDYGLHGLIFKRALVPWLRFFLKASFE
jgi:hypothetical protein